MPDPRLKTYTPQASSHLERAGAVLAARQVGEGAARGNVPPWHFERQNPYMIRVDSPASASHSMMVRRLCVTPAVGSLMQ